MKPSSLFLLRCPVCKRELSLDAEQISSSEIIGGSLICSCGRTYAIEHGIPHLIYPEILVSSDAESRQKYDNGAERYDEGLDWLFSSFHEDERIVRRHMVELLELQPGSRVLEVGCGTGRDSEHILNALDEEGRLYLHDISLPMLDRARRRLQFAGSRVEYLLSNAAYLPFDDQYFDAVFHFGGLNTFGEIRKALAEMSRVVRIGGKVVVGDEAVPPWLRQTEFGKVLINANPLYAAVPPLEFLPQIARNVCLRWILGNAFYLIDYRVGSGPPMVDIDLPIPGKGDSLRSRYMAKLKPGEDGSNPTADAPSGL